MLIDTQCHIFPEKYVEMLAKYSVFPKVEIHKEERMAKCVYDAGLVMRIVFDKYSIEGFLRSMEKSGIDISLISCNIPDPCTSLPKELVEDACKLINDEIHSWVTRYPDKFRGIASLPWNIPRAAVKEVQRVKDLEFVGVQLLTQNGGILADNEMLFEIYAECEKLDLPVFIHPTVPVWHDATADYNLTTAVGFPMDTSLTCIRMIYGRVFDKYPNLRVHMPHAGGVLPWLDGRLSYNPPAVPKPELKDGKTVVDYLKGANVWYDVCNPSSMLLHLFKTYMGCDKAMFATDYPFLPAKELLEFLENAGYNEEEMEKIKWKNANDFYKLNL